ncbi:hypothetical protein H5410_063508 [Solanum commersonii]|uniref:Anthocyanin acyltransferase n=1 Tax=Solanum commersonii TaxID=4109 RepID=A0A9J5WFW5_SOLCO|nr:hypothetical protein H5410_063508 [Solanum commersonii]
MELHVFVTLIRNSVQKAIDACAIGSADDIIATVANSYKEIFESKECGTNNDKVDKCIISSLLDLKDSYMSLFECESDIKAFTNVLENKERIQLQPLLFTEDNSISCQDQGEGVKFIKAKVNSKLNEFLEKAHKDVNLSLLCWPQDSWNVDTSNLYAMPVVIIQITEFECGGLALSMSHVHIAMDGYSIFTVINEWFKRDLSKLLLPRVPLEDRVESKVVAKRLYINEDSISRLRKEVGGDLCFMPSRVEMIMALLWRALIRASEKKHGYLKCSLMNIPINLRTRLISLPQVEKSFGNLGVDAPLKFIPGENKMDLHEFVTVIHDTVKETIITCDKTSPEDIVFAVSNIYNESFLAQDWGGSDEVDRYVSSSLCKFPIQEADFGWRKPCLMHFGSRHGQVCWLYDAECGNGICVQVDLKEDNMHLFECDNDIKDFFQF